VPLLHVLDEIALFLRDVRQQLVDRSFRGDRGGKDEIDAERPSLRILAQPLDVRRDLIGSVMRLAHDGETTGVDDRRCDVFAVRERDDGILDAERVAELRV
jgi:hypothetical protein